MFGTPWFAVISPRFIFTFVCACVGAISTTTLVLPTLVFLSFSCFFCLIC